ncbi:Chimerin, partial [Operophtera brumata]
MYDLVADGLITCHMEVKAHHILEMINSRASYTESPYVTLNRRKLKTLSQQVHQASNKSSPLLNKINKTEQDMSDDIVKKPLDLTPTIEDNPLVIKYSKSHGFKVHTFKGLN